MLSPTATDWGGGLKTHQPYRVGAYGSQAYNAKDVTHKEKGNGERKERGKQALLAPFLKLHFLE